MKKIFYTLFIVAALAFCANAQVRVGAFVGATTSPDPNEGPGGKTKFFPGIAVDAKFGVSKRFSVKVDGSASRTPQLPTLFTTDEGEHRPDGEFRVHPQFEARFGNFVARAGVDTFYQFGFEDDPGEEYSRAFGLNPTATVGIATKNHEVTATYLFRDKGTDLYGVRANYFYTLPKDIRVGFEANRLQFKERNREGYVDSYYEFDNVFKFSVDIPLFKRGYKH